MSFQMLYTMPLESWSDALRGASRFLWGLVDVCCISAPVDASMHQRRIPAARTARTGS